MSNARISSPWRSDEGYLIIVAAIACHRHHLVVAIIAVAVPSLPSLYHCRTIVVAVLFTVVAMPSLSLSPCHYCRCRLAIVVAVAMPSLLLSRRRNHHTIVVAITAVAIPPWSLLRCHRCSRRTCCRKEQQRSTMIMTTTTTATDAAAVLFEYLCSSVRKIATRYMDSLHLHLLLRGHLLESSDSNSYVLSYCFPE